MQYTYNADEKEIFPVDEDDTDIVVTLELDDGKEVDCEVLVIFEVEAQGGRDYIALMPTDENGDPIEDFGILIYRYDEEDDGTPIITNIENDREFNDANAVLESLLEEFMEDDE